MVNETVKNTLIEFKNKLKTLKKVAEEKQKAIVEFDYDRIEDAVKQEEEIVAEIEKFFGADFEKKKLFDLLKNDPELCKLRDEIESEASEVKKLNSENRYLLSHSISFVKGLIEVFQEAGKINKRV